MDLSDHCASVRIEIERFHQIFRQQISLSCVIPFDDRYEYLWVTNHVVSSERARKPVQYPEFIPGPRVIMTQCTMGNFEGPGTQADILEA